MLTRRLVPLAALVPLLLAPGCTASLEVPRGGAEEQPGDEVPVAPMPRVKKSLAELLIGKWQVTKINDKKYPDGWVYTLELTDIGVVCVVTDEKVRPAITATGTYSIKGKELHFVFSRREGGDDNLDKYEHEIIEVVDSKMIMNAKINHKSLGATSVKMELVRISP